MSAAGFNFGKSIHGFKSDSKRPNLKNQKPISKTISALQRKLLTIQLSKNHARITMRLALDGTRTFTPREKKILRHKFLSSESPSGLNFHLKSQ